MMNKDLSVYIHVPFCKRKCAYCDFLSFCADDSAIESYMNDLYNEIESKSDCFSDYTVKTVFFGGGTPSIAKSSQISAIVDLIHKKFHVSQDCEISIEQNPESMEKIKLRDYINSGINRLSIGMQSTHDTLLTKIERLHSYDIFCEKFDFARVAGFKNINIDIMFGLPEQTLLQQIDSINEIVNLSPEHVSCYSLILEENSKLYEKPDLLLPDEDSEREMYYKSIEILTGNGYNHYEISNFAKTGYECKHNIVYWKRGEYVGFGLGASSFIDKERYRNATDMNEYKNDFLVKYESEFLNPQDEYAEFMFLGLRMIEGIEVAEFYDCFKISIYDIYGTQIKKLTAEGLIETLGGKIKLTKKGIDLSNMVFVEFLL